MRPGGRLSREEFPNILLWDSFPFRDKAESRSQIVPCKLRGFVNRVLLRKRPAAHVPLDFGVRKSQG